MIYIDAYLIPIDPARIEAFEHFSKRVNDVFREYGAIRTVDCRLDEQVANDAGFHAEGARAELAAAGPLRDFKAAAAAEGRETVILSWTEWPSKEARDSGLAAALEDPRIQPLEGEETLFEGRRLIAGGFAQLLNS